jgi:hypothetical protein
MGRETVALVNWRGVTAETKLLLEASELILRGGLKDRIPRSAIAAFGRTQQGLALTVRGAPLNITMADAEANRWIKALATPPPDLRTKLNIGAAKRAYILVVRSQRSLQERWVNRPTKTKASG